MEKTRHTLAQVVERTWRIGCALCVVLLSAGCGDATLMPASSLRINEVMSANDGAAVDEVGETDDWIELRNDTDAPLNLADFALGDRVDRVAQLPSMSLAPGARVLLWADGSPEQGPLHLPFSIAAAGETLFLQRLDGTAVDTLVVPALKDNESYARIPESAREFSNCRYASPGRDNGAQCGPVPPPELTDPVTFSPFSWPEPFPAPRSPLTINELALRPAQFIELHNTTDAAVDLTRVSVRIAGHKPGEPWPTSNDGVEIPFDADALDAGGYVRAVVQPEHTIEIAFDPLFEGVVSVFRRDDGSVIDRVDFMSWPDGAVLARQPDGFGHHAFCQQATPDATNDVCDPLPSRSLSGRDRHLYTPGDFDALADGGSQLGISGVKFVIDREAGGVVHLLSSRAYDLHFRFVTEDIEGNARLDRCDAVQNATFRQRWAQFGREQYADTTGMRRYWLGTFDRYATGGQQVVHFIADDSISPEHMAEAFYIAVAHTNDVTAWRLHPQSQAQAVKMKAIDGQLPFYGVNEPLRDQVFQPLTVAVGFGVLRFVPVHELDDAELGPEVIVVTDDVPNDIALVAGLITETFQTPLAHVNLLSRNRDTPNLALRDARNDPRIASHFDQLVRLEVTADNFTLRPATIDEAQAHWDARRPTGMRISPRLDVSVRGVQPLADHELSSLPALGGKAAQLAELMRARGISYNYGGVITNCTGPIPTPRDAFAIPLVHGVEHFEASGARQIFDDGQAALRDPTSRGEVLERMRAAITSHPVEPTLLAEVEYVVGELFGNARVRMRSSSNTEDLPEFTGAGLYTSQSAALGDPDRRVEDVMRNVWAGLWLRRAYDERELAHVDQSQVAMGILVHEAFLSERANGVGISRNILDPIRSDQRYFNFQIGEAAVTNPAPGVTTEQLVHVPWAPGREGVAELEFLGRSSLTDGAVMTLAEVRQASCVLSAIANHFRPLVDPAQQNPWFAMDIELKLLGDGRQLLVKQARPYSFGSAEIPEGCRTP